jgi:predicted dehydrogenase
MKKVKVLIVGGQFGVYGHLAAWSLCKNVEVLGVVSSTLQKTVEINKKNSLPLVFETYEKAVQQADVISIAVPPHMQPQLAKMAIKYKKKIVFDKPLAANLQQAKAIKDQCAKSKIKTCINFEFIELETFKLAKDIIDKKIFGEVLHFFIDWRIESKAYKQKSQNWKSNPQDGGGFWLHYFPHMIHLMNWFFGDLKSHQFEIFGLKNFSSTLISGKVTTQKNVTGVVSGTCVGQMGLGHRIEIYTEKATIVLSNTGVDPIKGFELSVHSHSKTLKLNEKNVFKGKAAKLDSRALPMSKLFQKFISGKQVPNVNAAYEVQKVLASAKYKGRLK